MDTSETSRRLVDEVDLLLANAQLRDELEPYRDESIDDPSVTRMSLRTENEYLARVCEEAIRAGRKGADLQKGDGIRAPRCQFDLARIYLSLGEHELALDIIEQILAVPAQLSVPLLRLNPELMPLRANPRFQRLVGGETVQ